MLATSEVETVATVGRDDLRGLFHRLNNQLGIVLANAELLEARVGDEATRARAALVVESALEALATVRSLRRRLDETLEQGPAPAD